MHGETNKKMVNTELKKDDNKSNGKTRIAKRILCLVLSLAFIIPLALEGIKILISADGENIKAVEDSDARASFEAYYNTFKDALTGNDSSPFYDYSLNKTNNQFKKADGTNMTSINDMQNGQSMYVLLLSNAFISPGAENPIGAFLKYNGTHLNNAGLEPTAQPITEADYNSGRITDYIWRLTKVSDNTFAISHSVGFSGIYNSANETVVNQHSVLTAQPGEVRCWPGGATAGQVSTSLLDGGVERRQWIIEKVTYSSNNRDNYIVTGYDAAAQADNLYTIRSKGYGTYLNVGSYSEKTPNNLIKLFGTSLGGKYGGLPLEYVNTTKMQEADARWSQWNIFPILNSSTCIPTYNGAGNLANEYGGSVTYGKTETSLTSTITSLSKITPHTALVRKARRPDGTLFPDERLYVEENFPDDYYYGHGQLMNHDTVWGNHITYTQITNTAGSLLDSIDGKIAEPEIVELDHEGNISSKQYMTLTCGDHITKKNYMLWQISYNGVYLTADRSFNYNGGDKSYVGWKNNNNSANQRFFILYSFNKDGGYYISPISFTFVVHNSGNHSVEEENFRVLDIAAYSNPEMLQLWDYGYVSNSRFWIDTSAPLSVKTKVVDVLVQFAKNGDLKDGDLKSVSQARAYMNYSNNTLVYRNLLPGSAFYDMSEMGSDGFPIFSKNKYESLGFFYAFDTASIVTELEPGETVKVCYRLFYKGFSEGNSVIAKNADALNISYNPKYTLEDYEDGKLSSSYTYGTSSVAPFTIDIVPDIKIKLCWYVNDKNQKEGATKICTVIPNNVSGGEAYQVAHPTHRLENGKDISFTAYVSYSERDKRQTTLEIKGPTKELHGLYFFCYFLVGKNQGSGDIFKATFKEEDYSSYSTTSSNFLRLSIANNVVYHSLDANGNETGSTEDWLIYGTDFKLKSNNKAADSSTFKNNGYVKCTYDPDMKDHPIYKEHEFDEYDLTKASIDRASLVDLGYTIRPQADNSTEWRLFADTIENPNNNTATKQNYIDAYVDELGALTDAERDYWIFEDDTSFGFQNVTGAVYKKTSANDVKPLLYDTTVDLYSKEFGGTVSFIEKEAELFVDKFGTVFKAEQDNGWKIVYAPKAPDGTNQFTKYVYVPVVTSGTLNNKSKNNFQYSIDGGNEWNTLTSLGTSENDFSVFEAESSDAKTWYGDNSGNYRYAIKFDTIAFLEAIGKTTESGGISSNLTVEFKYSGGVSGGTGGGSDGWFDTSTGNTICGVITFIPFDYSTLS